VTVLHSVLSLQHEGLLASPTTLKKNDTKMIVIHNSNMTSFKRLSPEPISNTLMFIYFCVLHAYHCVPFTGECHGTAAYKAQTTFFYDVIGHR
jgi:hypothetical protein